MRNRWVVRAALPQDRRIELLSAINLPVADYRIIYMFNVAAGEIFLLVAIGGKSIVSRCRFGFAADARFCML
jgi:hypothetical protein